MRVRAPWLIVALALVALPPTLGCGGAERSGAEDAGARGDAGAASDAGPSLCIDCPDGAAGGDGGSAGREGPADDPAAFANACLDGRDQNGDAQLDCDDSSCAGAPSCCVGSITDACCTGTIAPIDLTFTGCDAAGCAALDGLVQFGSPGPVAVDHAIAPVADTAADSGAISLVDVDPRASLVTLEASIAIPSSTSAIDAVAFGLTASTTASARVSPVIAVVVSASRGDVTLQVGGEIVGTFAAPTDGAYYPYTLTIGPSGDAHVSGPGGTLDAHVALPAQALHAIVYGRATNPGSTPATFPARIASLAVHQRGCDSPTALARGSDPISIVDHTSSALLAGATAPSVATLGTDALLAFAAPSMAGSPLAIFIATRHPDGTFHVESNPPVVQPVLAGSTGESLTDPVLRDEGTYWTLFATLVSGGASQLVVSTGGADHSLVFGPFTTISVTELSGDFDAPTPIPGTPTMLIARHGTGAESELVLLALSDTASGAYAPEADICGADDTCATDARTARRIHAARLTTLAFDADEVRSPSLVVVNHVYRLYYAGRRGSRWSIGMLIAADLGFWRSANGGLPVLDADGTGFDAVSVMEPSAVAIDGELSLFYVGSNGVDTAIGVSHGSSFGL